MRAPFGAVAVSLALLALPATASAADTYVNGATGSDSNNCLQPTAGGAGVGPCATVGQGSFVAGNNDTIHVAPGTYNEQVILNFGAGSTGKSLIADPGNPANTIIDGGGSAAIVANATEGTVQGFTIRSDSSAVSLGGPATIKGNVMDTTGSGSSGVQLFSGAAGSTIDGNTISGNASNIRIGINTAANATIQNNTLTNLADPISMSNASPTVSKNDISGTPAIVGSPAAITVGASTANVTPVISDNYLHAPSATGVGGIKMSVCCGFSAGPTLKRNRIFDFASGISGGASTATLSLEGDEISSSETGSTGISVQQPVSATNATIFGNATDMFVQNAAITLDATILGTAISGNNISCTITNSRGPAGSNFWPGCDNFVTNASPGFVNAGTHDFHLTSSSAMLDAGGADSTNTDIDGDTRDKDAICPTGTNNRDIGADEFVPAMAPTGCPAAPNVTSVTPAGPANNNSPVVKGTSAPASTTIKLYRNASCTGTVIGSGTSANYLGATGVTATVADNSVTDIYANATNGSNQVSACSSTHVTYTEDSNAPGTPTIASTPVSPANNNNPSFSGTAESGSTVKVYSTSNCTGTPVASGSAASYATGLPINAPVADNSTTDFRVTATDVAGNVSSCSGAPDLTYVEDSAAPVTPSIASTPASPSNKNSPSFSGTAESGSTVKVYDTSNCTGTPVASGSAASYATGLPISAPVADNSTTDFRVTATDVAGNVSTCSATPDLTYVEDSTPASLTITKQPRRVKRIIHRHVRVKFRFVSDDPAATFTCRIDRRPLKACTSPKFFRVGKGTHRFVIRSIDAVGNQSARKIIKFRVKRIG